MLRLARECGITTAESRIETVAGKDVLLVKGFDRETAVKGYTRSRMISGLTLLRSDETPEARQNWSYVILVEELRGLSRRPRKMRRNSSAASASTRSSRTSMIIRAITRS
jgi:serine/threonine-protein kinase HipA